jgi:hypothetical protein
LVKVRIASGHYILNVFIVIQLYNSAPNAVETIRKNSDTITRKEGQHGERRVDNRGGHG